MNDRSIRPSLTPSKVCTAPTGALGRMLHFTRSAVAFSMSAHCDSARGAGCEHVARLDRDVAREMLEEIGQLPDLIARVDAHALLAVHRAGHPQVVGVTDLVHRDDLGPQRPESGDVLGGPET